MRVVAEFTTEPFHGEGEPPDHARRAWDVVQAAGLAGDFGPLGTEVEGERDVVLDTLREVMAAALDAGATRITLQLHTET
ncbi:MAG TPA: thiamine-binding protein [Nakamurella sp.]